jgi:hypothetical protein
VRNDRIVTSCKSFSLNPRMLENQDESHFRVIPIRSECGDTFFPIYEIDSSSIVI